MSPEQNTLIEAQQYYAEPGWLNTNSDNVIDALSKAFKSSSSPGEATNTLLLVYPQAIKGGEVKRWSKLLQDALSLQNDFDATQAKRDDELAAQFALSEHKKEMDAEFKIAMRRARKRLKPETILEAYLDIFKSQVYHQSPEEFSKEIAKSAIELARQVNIAESYAQLYLALAYAYSGWGDFERILKYARLAYEYFSSNKRYLEAGQSAFWVAFAERSMGVNSGNMQFYSIAQDWLDKSGAMFLKTSYPHQYAVIAHEKSVLFLLNRHYEQARQWAEVALKDAQNDYTIAITRHTLGMALSYLGQYDKASENFERSQAYLEGYNYNSQLASLMHARAYNQFLQKNIQGAISFVERGLALLEDLPKTPQHDKLRVQLEESLASLRKQ